MFLISIFDMSLRLSIKKILYILTNSFLYVIMRLITKNRKTKFLKMNIFLKKLLTNKNNNAIIYI